MNISFSGDVPHVLSIFVYPVVIIDKIKVMMMMTMCDMQRIILRPTSDILVEITPLIAVILLPWAVAKPKILATCESKLVLLEIHVTRQISIMWCVCRHLVKYLTPYLDWLQNSRTVKSISY